MISKVRTMFVVRYVAVVLSSYIRQGDYVFISVCLYLVATELTAELMSMKLGGRMWNASGKEPFHFECGSRTGGRSFL